MGFELGTQEQQLAFNFSTLQVLDILHAYTDDGAEMLATAPGIVNIKFDDLKQRLGTLSCILEDIRSTPAQITAPFLMLEERHLSQLATLAVEKSLNPEELEDIAKSPVGIRAEIILRHIEYTISENPYSHVIIGEHDEKILLSKLLVLEEKGDFKNIARIEQILQKVTKYSEIKKKYNETRLKDSKIVEFV